MIKNQTANHKQPSVTSYPICIFSLLLLPLHSPVGECGTHSCFSQPKRASCFSGFKVQHVECIQHLFPPHHPSTILNTPLQGPHVLKATFNTSITLGLIWIFFICKISETIARWSSISLMEKLRLMEKLLFTRVIKVFNLCMGCKS